MTFILSKLVGDALQPYVLLLAALALITIRVWRRRPAPGHRPLLLTAAVALLWAISWHPIAMLVPWSLGGRYPELTEVPADAQAIVVLGGGMVRPGWLSGPALGRLTRAEALWRLRPALTIIPSGASGQPFRPMGSEAQAMRRLLIHHGVPPDRVLPEPRSRTTYENARDVARLARARGWNRVVVVTDAEHLPRSVACFRHQGLVVYPAPTVARRLSFTPSDLVPNAEAVRQVQAGFHEYLGLAWYWATGRI